MQNFSEIEYDDLQDHESSPGILLEMQDRQRYFEGQLSRVGGTSGAGEDSREVADVQNAFKELLNGINGWEGRFSQVGFCLYIGVRLIFNEALLAEDREKIRRRGVVVHDAERRCAARYQDEQVYVCRLSYLFTPFLIVVPSIADFPPGLFRQLTTCQTAANEFLRQFWTSIYPPPADLPTPTSTPAQRSAKAAKMVGYLGKTHEKVDALVRAAVLEGVEGNRVVVVSGWFPLFFPRDSTHPLCIPLVMSRDI